MDREFEPFIRISGEAKDSMLANQAVQSLTNKKFHAQGGSVYALYPGANIESTVKFITAFQTISDYLDNLCDSSGVQDESSFRQLHTSMLDSVDVSRGLNDYYMYYPYKGDNSYLRYLVEACRKEILKLPSYHLITEKINNYVSLYSDLQVYKHLDVNIREKRLKEWALQYRQKYRDISWYEFSAAAGSTLGIFILFAAAQNPNLTKDEVDLIDFMYFPYICSLHILLDYFIDAEEDKKEGELNFCSYYVDKQHCRDRLSFFTDMALSGCRRLSFPGFHKTVVKGLLSMYLSDPKALMKENAAISRAMVHRGGLKTILFHKMCLGLRKHGKL
ncbi:MAG TPA: tetraprenyl-beta-curcumene synthase family protein [Clostridia bacterium]